MFKEELLKLLQFWKGLKDRRGGFYGACGYNGKIDVKADKGGVYHSRILWFFCNSYLYLKDEGLKEYINHCYEFLVGKLIDFEHLGAYWSVNYKGEPKDKGKHTYNNSFLIFALSQYYKVFQKPETLSLIMSLFRMIEKNKRDNGFYIEQFDRFYHPVKNKKLSSGRLFSPSAGATMNTTLHVMEAYTDLYEISRNVDVLKALKDILSLIENKIYNPSKHRLEVFFDKEFKPMGDIHSFGHDIEAAWLLDRAIRIADCGKEFEKLSLITQELSNCVLEDAFENAVINESVNGVKDCGRIWWVQAEAIVGFVNAFAKTGDVRFKDAAEKVWEYIKNNLDAGTEWYWKKTKDGRIPRKPLAGIWKCPYHNGRMLLEMEERKCF